MTSSLLANGTFFFPGPTEVRAEVLRAMQQPMIAHRGPVFEGMFSRIEDSLQQVFGTTRPVYVSSSSATGLMEAGVRGAPEGRILSIVNGAFSARFAAIVKACARESDVIEVAWGDVVDFDVLAERLRTTQYAAVTVVHSETSTGALTDVRTVSRLAHEHGAVCLVDSVTGIGAAELTFDEWGLDYALTGSQKALALPPGLAFAAATSSFIEGAARQPGRGLYFDLVEFDRYALKHQTPNTPAISLFFAADVQLAAIAAETMQARWARHAAMATRTYEWVDALASRHGGGIGVLARAGHRSPSVTSITLPSGVSSSNVLRAVSVRGFTIGSGYGKNKDTSIRIGHMGDHTVEGLNRCLAACDEALDEVLGPRQPGQS
ncbi:MAG: alanine--glyoxylate aminotransferase family protein [Gemmatimonadota bacterium]|nr:alanine--glyoxylate aminotransferase family protein [Gemmatimonadota bacterium]